MEFNQKKRKKIKKTGFTLVEIIVAVGIFSLVMLVAIGAVLAIVGANKKAQSLHNVINNFNLAIETMMRDMRTGYSYICANSPSTDCDDGDEFRFKSTQLGDGEEHNVTYRYEIDGDDKYIEKEVDGDSFRITSEDVQIDKLAFYSRGIPTSSDGDYIQPHVIVVIKGQAKINGAISKFNLQTLVSQRLLDI